MPDKFTITAATNNVSYEACTNGKITISPCSVNIIDGYRVDHVNEPFNAKIILDCSSCNRGARLANTNTANTTTNTDNQDEVLTVNNSLDNCIIYPNPNQGEFSIQVNNKNAARLSIYDVSGKTIYSTSLSDFYGKEKRINFSNNVPGIYMCIITNDKEQILQKTKIILN